MTAFELWQVANMTAQSVLLLATFLGALYVGIKQYQINKLLVELQNQPSIEVAIAGDQLHILNRGSTTVWLWGTHVQGYPVTLEEMPRQITPQGFYYIPLNLLHAALLQRLGANGEERLSARLFIKTSDDRKYVVRNVLYCVAKSSHISIHCQTVAVSREEWHEDEAP